MRNFTKFIIATLIIAGGFFAYSRYKPFKLQQTTFQTEQPTRRKIVRKKIFSGNLIPHKEIKLNTHITGVVEKLFVKEGDYVQQGTPIARIAIQPDPAKIETAKSDLHVAIIQRDKLRNKFLRDRVLFKKKMLAKEAYEESFASLEEAKERVTQAEKSLQIMQRGYTKVQQGPTANIIKSTTKGTILTLPAKEGSMVESGQHKEGGSAIATIGDMDNFLFNAKINEIDVVHLNPGMSFEVALNAFKEEKLKVTLTKISPKASEEEAKKGEILFEVEGIISKPKKNRKVPLRAGYVAIAEVILEQVDNVLAVPEGLIQREGEADVVKCLDNGQVIQKKVCLGLSDGLYAEIKEGLTEKDQLIIE